MQIQSLFQLSQNPWANGLRLALLNIGLAAFSGGSFLGVLWLISLLNAQIFANGGLPADAIPFPYPVLLIGYALIFPVAWGLFGQRLPNAQQERLKVALIGAAPLFGLSFLGYACVVGVFIFNEIAAGQIPIASVFVFGFLATLILFAGLICVGVVMWRGGGDGNKNSNPIAGISHGF